MTKISLFFMNFEKELYFFRLKLLNQAVQSVIERTKTLKKVYNNIIKIQHYSADY